MEAKTQLHVHVVLPEVSVNINVALLQERDRAQRTASLHCSRNYWYASGMMNDSESGREACQCTLAVQFIWGENISKMLQKLFSFYQGDICPYTIMAETVSLYRDWCCRVNTNDVVINHINHLHHPRFYPRYPLINSSWVGC